VTALDSPNIHFPEIGEPESDTTSVAEELASMRLISGRLDRLDESTRQRVLRWLVARYGEQ